MSALDQAFIKAYAKEPAASPEPRSTGQEQQSFPLSLGDAPYNDGSLYRVDVPVNNGPSAVVPPPHSRFARTGHALRSRFTAPQPSAVEPIAPPQVQPAEINTLLPRPHKPKPPSLAEIAQQLAGDTTLGATTVEYAAASASPPSAPVPVADEASVVAPTDSSEAKSRSDLPAAPIEKKKYRFDAPTTGLRGPHFHPRPALEETVEPMGDEAAEPPVAEEKKAVEPPPVVVAALVAEVEKPAIAPPVEEVPAVPAAPTTVATNINLAAWEVDSFRWPEVCLELQGDKDSYFAQAGKKLLAAREDGLKTLAIAGSLRGDGCSTLALILARVAAEAGVNVALVDADIASPQLGTLLGLEIPGGWQDAVSQKTTVAEVAVRSLQDKVTLYPLEQKSLGLSLYDSRGAKIFEQISAAHELTIIDLGPLPAGDAPIFATQDTPPVDAVVIVRDVRRTPLDHVQAIAARLYANGVEAVGLAENFVGSPS